MPSLSCKGNATCEICSTQNKQSLNSFSTQGEIFISNTLSQLILLFFNTVQNSLDLPRSQETSKNVSKKHL